MSEVRKLSPAMQELLDAIGRGVRVHYMQGLDAYYFRGDTMKRCTQQVFGLMDRGLVRIDDNNIVRLLSEGGDGG